MTLMSGAIENAVDEWGVSERTFTERLDTRDGSGTAGRRGTLMLTQPRRPSTSTVMSVTTTNRTAQASPTLHSAPPALLNRCEIGRSGRGQGGRMCFGGFGRR